MDKCRKKIVIILLFSFVLQITLSCWATSEDISTNSYKIYPLGYKEDSVYYMICSFKKADSPLSLDTLEIEFFKETVDVDSVFKIHPSELPSNLEYSDIKVNILEKYFYQNLLDFPLEWDIETDANLDKCSITLHSKIADEKISVIDLPLNEYEKALGKPSRIEDIKTYLFEPHKFVMISFVKVFKSPEIEELIPLVQTYSWNKFYNEILLKICRLLNNTGMALYRIGNYPEAHKYFLSAQHEKLPITYYNTACICALLNDVSGAINNLKKYASAQPNIWKKKVKKDTDFDGIKNILEFQDFLKNYE